MGQKATIRISELVSWVATAVGFIVDTIALIGLFSAFRLGNIVTDHVSLELPQIDIGNISLKWKDATLVVFLYLLFSTIFFIKAKLFDIDDLATTDNKLYTLLSFLAFNFLVLTSFLWVAVFILTNSITAYFYQILLGWLISTLLSLNFINSYVLKGITGVGNYLARLSLISIVIGPFLALLVELVFGIPLLSAFEISSLWFLYMVVYSAISLFLWFWFVILVLAFDSWYSNNIA